MATGSVTNGPLAIEYGGTGASTSNDVRNIFGLYYGIKQLNNDFVTVPVADPASRYLLFVSRYAEERPYSAAYIRVCVIGAKRSDGATASIDLYKGSSAGTVALRTNSEHTEMTVRIENASHTYWHEVFLIRIA